MIAGTPSRTALFAARHRALHQILEQGAIFADPLALRILGDGRWVHEIADADLQAGRPMRMFIALRSRFADDCVRAALARFVSQIVILGAGLDMTAYRLDCGSDAAVFEVDHPATQAWKRQMLNAAGIASPPSLRFVGVDFEREHLGDRLSACGFDPARPSLFVWLGVTPYLTRAAITASLGWVATLPGGAEIVFDYGEPPDRLNGAAREARQTRMSQLAELGEPWISLFPPASMRDLLRAAGFARVEDRHGWEVAALYSDNVTKTEAGGGHIVHACSAAVPT